MRELREMPDFLRTGLICGAWPILAGFGCLFGAMATHDLVPLAAFCFGYLGLFVFGFGLIFNVLGLTMVLSFLYRSRSDAKLIRRWALWTLFAVVLLAANYPAAQFCWTHGAAIVLPDSDTD